jgi:hypothetical protein
VPIWPPSQTQPAATAACENPLAGASDVGLWSLTSTIHVSCLILDVPLGSVLSRHDFLSRRDFLSRHDYTNRMMGHGSIAGPVPANLV